MAAAAYADKSADSAPPLILAAVRYGRQAQKDLDLPAGMPYKLSRLWFAYDAMKGYVRAGKVNNTSGWTKQNPDHWEMVSWVIAKRKKGG